MSKKEKVALQRSDDFEEMDELLSSALADLDESNQRVLSILENEDGDVQESVEEEAASGAPDTDAAKSGEPDLDEQAAASDSES